MTKQSRNFTVGTKCEASASAGRAEYAARAEVSDCEQWDAPFSCTKPLPLHICLHCNAPSGTPHSPPVSLWVPPLPHSVHHSLPSLFSPASHSPLVSVRPSQPSAAPFSPSQHSTAPFSLQASTSHTPLRLYLRISVLFLFFFVSGIMCACVAGSVLLSLVAANLRFPRRLT